MTEGLSSDHPADVLVRAIGRVGSPVCVGIDPVLERLPVAVRERSGSDPVDAIEAFSRDVVNAVSDVAAAVKFQSACFERFGWKGVRALERAMADARQRSMVVILDAKRGDIPISTTHYAAGAKNAGAHFITVSGYLGPEGITPFLEQGLGVFVLVRTSNPDSAIVQAQRLEAGGTVAESVARMVRDLGQSRMGACGMSAVGAVVGATQSREAEMLRKLMPDQPFLVPGLGAQGGTADDVHCMVRRGARTDRAGVLVTASRSILYPQVRGGDEKGAMAGAARELASQVSVALKTLPA